MSEESTMAVCHHDNRDLLVSGVIDGEAVNKFGCNDCGETQIEELDC